MTSDGEYIVLDIRPTVNKDDTTYRAEGVYTDSDKIRVDSGRIEQIGGWVTRPLSEPFTGVARDIVAWKEIRDMPHYAAGTHKKLQIEQLGTLYDITPIETSASVSNAITVSANGVSALVSAAAHSRAVGDYILFTSVSAVSVGGITFQGRQYPITTVPDANSFIVTTSTTATANANSDGGAAVLHYLLGTGRQSNGAAYGYGAGTYGTSGAATVANATGTDIVNTTLNSTSVIVSVTGHGRTVGTQIHFASLADVSVGGINLRNNYYFITSIPGANSFTIDTSTTATATSASDGGAAIIDYQLDGWGSPRGGGGLAARLRQWSLTLWGEDLIACPRGGKIYHWDATTSVSTRASVISNAPVSNNVVFTHPNRHLVILGTQPVGTSEIDPLEIRWSDRENFRVFAVCAGTRAGSFRLQGQGSEIVGYTISKRETLILTDATVWSMRALDNELVFGFDVLSNNAGLIAQHAIVDKDGKSFWMGNNDFYMYSGQVQKIPSNIKDYVFGRLDADQKEKVFAGLNSDHNEVMWLYQSEESTNDDIDSYAKYNYVEDTWDVGTFDRVVWHDTGTFENPIAVNASGVVYNHEVGLTADGSAISSYIESSYFDIGEGKEMMLVDQMIPDFVLSGTLNFSIVTKKWPNGPEVTKGPFEITSNTEKVNLRARGRQAKIRFSTSTVGSNWGIGKPRYRIKTDGER